MEQLVQSLKDGAMQLLQVPFPALQPGCILVRNHFSVISAGTEGKSVKDARLGYVAKARARKEEVGKVMKSVQNFGLIPTYKMVMNKLESPSPLGYCCAGEVIAVASDVKDFRIGDFVACGGNTAVHAEVVAVPVNLCVKISNDVNIRDAAFATLGAIAMQGIRQADLRLGENAVVIGLGLIGQLTIQMLNAAGIRTIGIDIDERMVQLASANGCELSINRRSETLENDVLDFTAGHGTDAVIITAGTDSTDPVDLAGALSRKKGKVVIVGAVPTGFKRANYFKKELELKMSSSYGPGRYDREYEEEGIDYPYAYVRWTENRNMEAFVELLRKGKLNIAGLITHEYPFSKAEDAYKVIVEKTEPFTGMVLKYDVKKELVSNVKLAERKYSKSQPVIGLIGAGSFAQNYLLPALKDKAQLAIVATARPNNARYIADKYSFAACTGNASEVFSDKDVNTVFIATRHDTHAEYVMEALKSNKNIFVEKPLCLTENDLHQIKAIYDTKSVQLMLGFNRRFSPYTETLRSFISQSEKLSSASPIAINYRINAGVVAADHWVHDPKVGGGRILGEVCHFIDLCTFITGSKVAGVSANSMNTADGKTDTLNVNLSFANGSIANISYFSNGQKELPKERLEVFAGGVVAIIDDFKSVVTYGKTVSEKSGKQDKGHAKEVELFMNSIREGKNAPIPFDEIYHSMLVTFKVLESISMNGELVKLA
ncbi:MAG TPA: bi-domain-containing oxidoreductase [Bacteroidia bacterium]|mgnify:CR=1 FL=1|nr:bi-domain-containing oxidoreductase [Bacteroidia bacterium]